jgi:iron-sulfur cluster repair protein YtfE (RIC family)
MTGTSTFTMTIGEIVAADYRAAAVLERHGIDFCCHAARTLDRGCRDAGIYILFPKASALEAASH